MSTAATLRGLLLDKIRAIAIDSTEEEDKLTSKLMNIIQYYQRLQKRRRDENDEGTAEVMATMSTLR
jgi:Asp-tRNA(Asn)/Glu-tRNA(Gln) amidotransferase C subunit